MADENLKAISSIDDTVLGTKLSEVYTYGEFLLLLHKHCPQLKKCANGGRAKSITILDINNGSGYMSCIYKTTVGFEESDKVFSVVIKVPTSEKLLIDMEDGKLDNLASNVHNTECKFYELFNDVNDGFAPKVYCTEVASKGKPGFIVMDDLSHCCITIGMFKSSTVNQFYNVAKKIAHFQAVSLANGKDLSTFNDHFHAENYHTDIFEPLVAKLPEYDPKFKEPVERLRKVLSKRFTTYALYEKPQEYNCLAPSHGDLWANNILFERNEDGSVSDTPLHFIDWQLLSEANPYFDIGRFLITGADGEIRREIQPDFAEKFYKMLVDEYEKQSNGRLKPNFTLEQGQELFDLAILEQTSVLMILLPFVSTDKTGRNGSPKVVEAKLEKLALRTWLGLQDAIELVDKWQLDDFANRK